MLNADSTMLTYSYPLFAQVDCLTSHEILLGLYYQKLTKIGTRIRYYINYFMCDVINHPCLNSHDGLVVEVLTGISTCIWVFCADTCPSSILVYLISMSLKVTRSLLYLKIRTIPKLKWFFARWGRVTHLCVSKLTSIASDNGLSPERRQAIIWNNAGILLIGP